jgi:hypothetical protein
MVGIPEVKAVDEAISSGPKLWNLWKKFRQTDVVERLTKENELLKVQLDVKAQFERRKAGMTRRQEDDNMYRDDEGRYYCGLCADVDSKFVGLTNQSADGGSYYCRIHQHHFETEEYRNRRRERRQNYPLPSRFGRMGRRFY